MGEISFLTTLVVMTFSRMGFIIGCLIGLIFTYQQFPIGCAEYNKTVFIAEKCFHAVLLGLGSWMGGVLGAEIGIRGSRLLEEFGPWTVAPLFGPFLFLLCHSATEWIMKEVTEFPSDSSSSQNPS